MWPATRAWAGPIALAVLVMTIDQWTKALIVEGIGPGSPFGSVRLGPEWLALEYSENRGVAFGLLAGKPLLAALTGTLIAVALAWHVARQPMTTALVIGAGLALGGAASNLVDRARLGYVVDFVAIGAWPNFNVADAAICGGVLLLTLDAALRQGDGDATERLNE